MPTLLKSVTASILDNFTANLYCFSTLSAEAQFETYINLNGFVAYLQTFKQADNVELLEKPLNFGIKNQYNLPVTTLEISY